MKKIRSVLLLIISIISIQARASAQEPDEILLKRKKWREASDDKQDNNSKAQDKLKKWRESRSHGDRASAKGADGNNVQLLVYPDTGKTRKYKFVGLEVEKRPVEIYLDGKLLYKEEVTQYPFDEVIPDIKHNLELT